jgi:hypothetical protein
MSVLAKMLSCSTLLTTTAVLTSVIGFAPSAKADRLCLQVCEQGSCQIRCFETDHTYSDVRDRDLFLRHGRADLFLDR